MIASPDGAVSHLALFKVATREYLGHRVKPLFMPKPLCGPGIRVHNLLGRVLGDARSSAPGWRNISTSR